MGLPETLPRMFHDVIKVLPRKSPLESYREFVSAWDIFVGKDYFRVDWRVNVEGTTEYRRAADCNVSSALSWKQLNPKEGRRES